MSATMYSISPFKKIFRENAEVNVYCSFTVSRDFRGLHMILMDRTKVPGVPLDVIFFKFMFLESILNLKFERVQLLLLHLANA